MEQGDLPNQVNQSNIPELSIPPPPPPQLNIDNIKVIQIDEFIQNRLKKMQIFEDMPSQIRERINQIAMIAFNKKRKRLQLQIYAIKIGQQSDELSSKIKKIEDIDLSAGTDGEGTGEGLKREDGEGKVQCERCEYWFTNAEMKSHKIQHSSQILDFLYLGSAYNSNNHKELKVRTNISYILNAAVELNNVFPDEFTYMKLDIEDVITEKILIHFEESIKFIQKARDEGKNILVHCIQGISRSATLVIAYLMSTGMSLKDSVDHVKSIRSVAKPNPAFVKELLEYERQLYQKNSCTGEYINSLYKFVINKE